MDFLAIGGLILFVAIVLAYFTGSISKYGSGELEAMREKTWDPEERKANLLRKQQATRNRMKSLGIKTLHEGHKGWAVVKPMAVKEEAPKNVTVLKRRPH